MILSSKQIRQPINSPAPESRHKDYNRYKYYDRLRTSFIGSHMAQSQTSNIGDNDGPGEHLGDFLRPPQHVIDQ